MKAAFLSLAMLVAANAASAAVIDTTTQTGFDFRCLGIDSSCGQTFGQIFTVGGPETYLSSFSFAPTAVQGSPLNVQFSIYSWSGTDKTGSALFKSGVFALTNTAGSTLLNYTPNLNLTQGNQYIAFLDTANLGNSDNATSGFMYIGEKYSGGEFRWERNSGDGYWNGTGGDTQFRAVFTSAPAAVPEPASLALLVFGAASLMGARRRKAAK